MTPKNKGRLIQPIVRFKWGSTDLTHMVNAIDITLSDNPRTCPICKVGWKPTQDAFKQFSELKANSVRKPWNVGLGYTNTDMFSMSFSYANVSLSTGAKPSLETTGVSPIKGCWTDTEISYTRKEEISLAEFPNSLKSFVGPCANAVHIQFVGQAEEYAKTVKIRDVEHKMTPHSILLKVMREHGIDVVNSDTSVDNGPILLSYTPNTQGELKKDPLNEKAGKPRVRSFHILGPTLITTIKRSQSFNLSKNLIAGLASPQNPVVPQVKQLDAAQAEVVSEQSIASQSSPLGVSGQTNPSTEETSITEGGDGKTDPKIALARLVSTRMNTTFPMLPKLVGIKPRDVVVVAGNNDYLEDWIVSNVTYSFRTEGYVNLSVSGKRPFVGSEPIFEGSTVAPLIRSTVKELKTVEDWSHYYWMF